MCGRSDTVYVYLTMYCSGSHCWTGRRAGSRTCRSN